MTTLETHHSEMIDRKTSRSICDAVGERLQQFMRPQHVGPAPDLERLIGEMRRRESESGMSIEPSAGRRPQFFP
jgi:hypothetical protein